MIKIVESILRLWGLFRMGEKTTLLYWGLKGKPSTFSVPIAVALAATDNRSLIEPTHSPTHPHILE